MPADPRRGVTIGFPRVAGGLVRAAAIALTVTLAVTAVWSLTAVGAADATPSANAAPSAAPGEAPIVHQGEPTSDTPERIRADTERILARDEFSYKKGYVERFLEWLADRLGNREVTTPSQGGGFLSGIIGTLVVWSILLAALGAVIYIVVRYVRFRRPKLAKKEAEAPDTVIEHSRSVKEWNSEAEQLEAAGDWKQAIRARYRLLVRELTDRGQLPDIAGSTTTELREALAKSTPLATDDFDVASTLFELPWYAAEETGPEENARLRHLSDEILAVER